MNTADRLELIEFASARLTFWSKVLAEVLENRDPGVRTPEQSARAQRDDEAEQLRRLFRHRVRQDRHRQPPLPADLGGRS